MPGRVDHRGVMGPDAANAPTLPGKPTTRTITIPREDLESNYQVLLHNDDVNEMHDVAAWLMEVFQIAHADAWAIMSEAHCTGVALCCTEPRPDAERHRDQLRSFGLSATIEPS